MRATLLALLATATIASAQTYQGGVRGAVRDATGIIPGASVTLTHVGTNQSRRTATNALGQYVLANVPPGVYSLTVSVDGFKPYEQSGIELRVQDFHVIDVTLELGSVEETVVVTGETPLLDTATANIGASIDADEMVLLPTPSRNPFYLSITTPSVVPTGDPQFQRMQDQTFTSALSVGGGPNRGNNYTLDGVPITDLGNRAVITPSMESIEEVKVQIRTYDAEMGRTGGGVFNTVHRRGSNQWSGSALIQNRPNWGQGQLYFEKEAGAPKADSYYHLWGGSLGGAIVRDKTFFWASTEGYRTSVTRNRIITLPSAAMTRGDFSQFDRTIYDPLTTRPDPDPNNPGGFIRDPFPGNIIPADRLDPAGLSIASFLTAGPPGNSSASANVVDAAEQFSLNLTHELTDRWSLSGTYMFYESDQPFPLFLGGPYDLNNGEIHRRVHTVALNNTYLIGEDSVLTFRYGYFTFDDDVAVPEFDVSTLGFSDRFLSQISDDIFPRIFLGNYYTGGGDAGRDARNYSHSVNGTWSKFIGSHTVKVGGDYRRMGTDIDLPGNTAGEFGFNEAFTQGPDPTNPERNTGDPLASLLLGHPSFGVLDVNIPRQHYTDYVAAFVHDDWRVSENFVLSLGLRIEHENGLKEKNDLQTVGFDRETPWPIQPIDGMTLRGGLLYAGKNGAPRHQGDPNAVKLGPRFGMTYSIDENTVVRGGYGVFWAPYQPTFEEARGFEAPTFYATPDSLVPTGSLADPFPNGINQPVGSELGLLTGAGDEINFADQFRRSAYVHQFSVDVQRELPGDIAVTVGYLGSRSEQIGVGGGAGGPVNINQLDPELQRLGPALLEPVENPFFGNPLFGNLSETETVERRQLLRPYPQFGDLFALQVSEGKRRYHALVLRAEKRFRQGWSARINYTFSRTDDNVFGEGNTFSGRFSVPLDSTNLDGEWARSILDTPHRLNVSAIYELPWGVGRRWLDGGGLASHILGGWTFSTTGFLQSGFPVAVIQVPPNTNVFSQIQRPNVVPGIAPGHDGSTIDNLDSYLNPDAWAQADAFTFGDAPRTDARVRSPFRNNWDVAFQKSAHAGPVRTTFRLEIINVFDRPDLGGPGIVFGTRNFGKITNVVGFARTFQFTLRFDW